MPGFLIYLLPSLLYALIAMLQFRARETDWIRLAVSLPFLLHGYALYSNLFVEAGEGLNFGIANSISTIV